MPQTQTISKEFFCNKFASACHPDLFLSLAVATIPILTNILINLNIINICFSIQARCLAIGHQEEESSHGRMLQVI